MSNMLARLFGVKKEVVGPQRYIDGCDYDEYCGTRTRTQLRYMANGRIVRIGCC